MQKWDKQIDQATLNNEKAVLEALKKNYQDALDEINDKIAILLGRQDADMQHVIYQVEYQKALKTQIEGILDMLQANEFETISEYLTKCYEEGYQGALYSMQMQGVPLMLPIDQEQVVKAIQHDTMLSESLYNSLGKDIKALSKQIAGEISRGIATGKMFKEIAKDINGYTRIGMNNAMRIARTEGHRIQSQANYDAQVKAKSKGADIVKIWSSALDAKTRDAHMELDGQQKEVKEPFTYGRHKAMFPGEFGVAHLDINCRCRAISKARWLLDAESTKMLGDVSKMSDKQKETIAKKLGMNPDDLAQYSNQIIPVKAKDYADFKRQYNKLWHYEGSKLQEEAEARIAGYKKDKSAESVRVSPQKMNGEDTQRTLSQGTKISTKNYTSDYGIVNRKLVNSKEYHDKYANLTEHKAVNETMYQEAMKMLEHRDGTPYEDMVAIDARTGKVILSVTDSKDVGKLTISQEDYDKMVNYNGNLILLHNHPNSSRTSYTDILRLKEKNIYAIASAGHDGSISYVYDLKENFDIEKFWEEAYNNYKEIYGDNILAKHYATDLLYELGVFKTESR